MMGYARLLGLMVNEPLMAHPRKVATVYSYLRGRMNLPGLEAPETQHAAQVDALFRPPKGANAFVGSTPSTEDGSWMRREPYRLEQGVAIITAAGSFVNRGAWIGDDGSGLISYEGLKFQMQRAGRDQRVKAVILDGESPGGQATGAMELAQATRELRAQKPVYAVVNGMAASAGYAWMAGATRIITTPSGISGSIGVVFLHLDQSEKLDAEGVKPTFIFAGDHKVDGNQLEPLTDAVRDDLRAEVKATYELFLNTVAEGRGSRLSRTKARDTQARTFMGQEAVDAGLADAVGTFEEVLAETISKVRNSASSARGSKGMSRMGIDTEDNAGGGQQQPQAGGARTFTQADLDAATETGRREGAGSAQARLDKILADPRCKGKETAALNLARLSPAMSAEDVGAYVEANVAAPAAGGPAPPAPPSVRDRAEASGGNLGAAPTHTDPANPGGRQTAEDASRKGYEAPMAEAKKRFEAQNARR